MISSNDKSETFRRDDICPLAIWHLVAVGAAQLALILLFVDWRLSWAPFVAFAVVMASGPFFPRLGLFLPVVMQGPAGARAVALTFDDGPHPATTPPLLALLKKNGIRAAFFVTGRQAQAHPELIQAILADGHEIGNHSFSHDIFLALRSRKRLMREIADCQAALAALGVQPLAFRPPVGIVNPPMRAILLRLGLVCVTFNCRGPDVGNRRLDSLARRILKRVAPGDIVLLHDKPPPTRPVSDWLQEIEALLVGLARRELTVDPLSRLLRRPIMRPGHAENAGPVGVFYDSVAATYDEEQARPAMSRVRRAEERLIDARLSKLIGPHDAVMELGAGTGRFSLQLAKLARRVTAVDVSPEMLAILQHKARAAGLTNVLCQVGDFCEAAFAGPFDLICAFSCFEYVGNLPVLLGRLAICLAPGGRLYFTTAHRSFFRFFTQIGNALRQGIWLRARSRSEIEAALRAAGLAPLEMTAAVFGGPGGGMLVEVVAGRPEPALGRV